MEELIKKIAFAIKNTEFENKTYIAGGYVRDLIMDNESKDIDFVVEVENGGIKLVHFLSQKLNGTEPVIFERFQTAQITIDNIPLEFVMTRKEFYNSEDRNCDVKFGTIHDDVKRRDFTINSLLLNISTNEILDLCNGKQDIKNEIIKTTYISDTIFNDDPLRILRAIRFASRFNFEIEEETWFSLVRNVKNLDKISEERIRTELISILSTNYSRNGINLLIKSGVLRQLGLYNILNNNTLCNNFIYCSNYLQRLVILLYMVDSNKILEFLLKYKFTNNEIYYVTNVIKYSKDLLNDGSLYNLRKIKSIIPEYFKIITDFYFFSGDFHSGKRFNDMHKVLEEDVISIKNLPINADKLMLKYNLSQSKLLGDILKFEQELLFKNIKIKEQDIYLAIETEFKL